MPELTPKERLQPALLDRLTDEEPDLSQEPRERRVMSLQKLRACVIRDLSWLLNTGRTLTDQDLDGFDQVRNSTLNFGLPNLTGFTAANLPVAEIERVLRQAILDFEPRILPRSVQVRAVLAPEEMSRHAVSFEIRGDLYAEPLPLQLYLRTDIDLETGGVVVESAGRGGDS